MFDVEYGILDVVWAAVMLVYDELGDSELDT